MNTYKALIKDYTDDQRGPIIAMLVQPRKHLGKDFLRNVARYMWSKCYYGRDRDLCADIYMNGSFVANMSCIYLARYRRLHTSICGKFPSDPCTFRAFNTIPPYNPPENKEQLLSASIYYMIETDTL